MVYLSPSQQPLTLKVLYYMHNKKEIERLVEKIPAEMQKKNFWVVWRYEWHEGESKPRKLPYKAKEYLYQREQGFPPVNLRASSADAATWSSFDEAIAAYAGGEFDGVGFCFGANYVGIDLDKRCSPGLFGNPKGLDFNAACIIRDLNSYTEFSPSGSGVHIICKADCEQLFSEYTQTHKAIGVEVYSKERFFTMTGNLISGVLGLDISSEINERQNEIEAFAEKWLPKKKKPLSVVGNAEQALSVSDEDILARLENSSPLAFEILQGKYDLIGDRTKADGSPDWSRLIPAALFALASWTQDASQISRIIESSQLYVASGWESSKWARLRAELLDNAKELASKLFELNHKLMIEQAVEQATGYYEPQAKAIAEPQVKEIAELEETENYADIAHAQIKAKLAEESHIVQEWEKMIALASEEKSDWIIDGLLDSGTLTVLSGLPYCGKTTLMFSLIVNVALGKNFLDKITQSVPVCLVNADMNLNRIIVNKIKKVYPKDEDIMGLQGKFFCVDKFDTENGIECLQRVKEVIEEKIGHAAPKGLFIVDTLRSAFLVGKDGQSENDSTTMTGILKPLRQLARETGWAIILLHHNSKGSDSYAGSAAILGCSDGYWTMRRPEGSSIATLMITDRYDNNLKVQITQKEDGNLSINRCVAEVKANINREFIDKFSTLAPEAWTMQDICEELELSRTSARRLVEESETPGMAPRLERIGKGSKTDPYRWFRV